MKHAWWDCATITNITDRERALACAFLLARKVYESPYVRLDLKERHAAFMRLWARAGQQ